MADAMTFGVAVKQQGDIVIAVDGRMKFHDGRTPAEQVLKSVRLNKSLCLAMSGDTPYMVPILDALGLPTEDIPHDRLFQVWEESGEELPIGYNKAKVIIKATLPELVSAAQARGEIDKLVGILLAGKLSTGPFLCNWGSIAEALKCGDDPCQPQQEASARYGGCLFIGRIPSEGTIERDRLMKLVLGEGRIAGAEPRLVSAVRFISAWDAGKTKSVGMNVSTRRFSNEFRLEWDILGEPSN